MTAPLQLFVDAQYASPYAMSVFVALHEKGLAFDLSTVDLGAGAQLAPGYAALSRTRRVPTLVQGDFALSESSAITEYVDAAFAGTPLYPTGPHQLARARQVQAWLRSDLMPIRVERPTEVLFHDARYAPLSAAALAAADKLFAAAQALLPEGADHLFDAWSIADLDLAVMLNRLVLHGDAVPERLTAYARRQWERPAVRLWLERERPPL